MNRLSWVHSNRSLPYAHLAGGTARLADFLQTAPVAAIRTGWNQPDMPGALEMLQHGFDHHRGRAQPGGKLGCFQCAPGLNLGKQLLQQAYTLSTWRDDKPAFHLQWTNPASEKC